MRITIFNQCHNVDKRTLQKCSKCCSRDIEYGTRVIRYQKRVSNFRSERQQEQSLRYYNPEIACEKVIEEEAMAFESEMIA